MKNSEKKIDFSIIVEWENSRNTGESRPQEMLKILAQQVKNKIHLDHSNIELIVACDPLEADPALVLELVNEHWRDLSDSLDIRVVTIPDSSYYALKNQASQLAKGEIIVFIDCDVLPQPDWLNNVLLPFRDPKIGVSQGATYVEPHSLFTTALALAWVFPLRRRDGSLSERNNVFANNIAFRRNVFLEYPYPALRTWRGQCIAQRKTLKRHQIVINWSEKARTIHPFPHGLWGVVKRACLNGLDHVARYEMEGGAQADWRASYRRFKLMRRRARKRREKMSNELALSGPDKIACDLIAAGYWGVALLSALMLHIFPNFWRGVFKDLPA